MWVMILAQATPSETTNHLVGGVIAAGAWSHSMTFPGEWVTGGSIFFRGKTWEEIPKSSENQGFF